MAGLDNNTKLLLPLNGNDGAKEIVDNGSTGHIVTQVGTASLTTAQKKFGSTSLVLDGNSDYLTIPDSADWDIGSDNFTFDFWLRTPSTIAGYLPLFSQNVIGGTDGYVFTYHSSIGFRFMKNASTAFNISYTLSTSTWYHIALVRNGNDLKVYVNGTSAGTADVTGQTWASSAQTFKVGYGTSYTGAVWAGEYYLNGYIDEFRISNTARWTSNFTPETSAYTSDTNTKLLLHMDTHDISGDGGSNSYHIPTFVGTAQIDKAISTPFSKGVCFFDGNSDYLTIPDSADWDFGSGDFTIDCWIKPSGTDWQAVFCRESPTTGYWPAILRIKPETNTVFFQSYQAVALTTNWSIYTTVDVDLDDGNWHHLAVIRYGNSQKIYVDGVSYGTPGNFSGAIQDTAFVVDIGAYVNGTGTTRTGFVNGYMSEFRVSKGIARWTSNFTPPTEPYTSDSYTKLLISLNGNDGAKEIVDNGSTGHIVTQVGTASLTTAQKKFGSTSLVLDGNSDYLTIPDSADWDFGTGDFTIDFWARFNSLSASDYYGICGQYADASNWWRLLVYGTGQIFITSCVSGTEKYARVDAGTISNINQWYHIAIVRNNSSSKIYVNGSYVTTTDTLLGSDFTNLNSILYIGKMVEGASNYYTNGYIDEFRISKGIARWTSNFTPPTEPHTSDSDTKLLLHMNTHDISDSHHIPTFVGTAQIDKDVSEPFDSGVLMLDGNSDYLTFQDSSDWDFIGSAVDSQTIDFWVKHNSTVGSMTYLAQYEDDNNVWIVRHFGGSGLQFAGISGGNVVVNTGLGGIINDSNWHHVALCKVGSLYGIYLDGQQVKFVDDSSTDTFTGTLRVGGTYTSGTPSLLNGYMDEIRIQKSNYFDASPVVGLTDTITVPTEPYSYVAQLIKSRNQCIIIF